MSIIPLIIEGTNRNVVETDQEFHDCGGLEGHAILIKNINNKQLLSETDSNVSYDLSVGREFRDHRDPSRRELKKNGKITLLPGAAVIIETEEYLHLPKSMFGLIIPKVTLLQKGLSNTSSKVDPGYNGHLLITTFNLGKKTVELNRNESFCSLHMHTVGDGARPYGKTSKRIADFKENKMLYKARDFIDIHQAIFTFATTIVLIILAYLQLKK